MDSQSRINLTTENQLCSQIKRSENRLHLSGVGGSIESELEGTMMVNNTPTTFHIVDKCNDIPTIL